MTKWNKTGNLMLGQLYDEKRDRYFGSIFRNEMEFHVFTRTQDGFCDKCDLDPPGRTDEEGYLLPGRLFHSRASEYPETYFADWTSKRLYVESSQKSWINYDVFRLDEDGSAVRRCLTEHGQLQLLTGGYGESESAKDFMTCERAKIGLIFNFNTNQLKQLIEDFPEDFELYLGDAPAEFSLNRVVDEIYYGGQVMVRFEGCDEHIDRLEADVELFAKCLVGDCEPGALDKLPACGVWIGPGSVDGTSDVVGPRNTDLRSAFDDVMKYFQDVQALNHGKGIALWWYSFQSSQYKRFNIASGLNLKQSRLWTTPKVRSSVAYSVAPCNPAKLYVEIIRLEKELLSHNQETVVELKGEFQKGLRHFRKKLTGLLQNNDVEKKVASVKKLIKDYEISDCAPARIKARLEAQLELEVNNRLRCIAEMKSKGYEILPSQGVSGDYVLFEFPRFAQNMTSWKDNYEFFMSLVKGNEKSARPRGFYIDELVDGEFAVKRCRGGEVLVNDMLSDYRRAFSRPLVKYEVSFLSAPEPSEADAKGILSLPCPFSWSGGCPSTFKHWECAKCGVHIRYDSEKSSTWCRCGVSPLEQCTFRCSHQSHGLAPVHPLRTLSDISPRIETNVLLLGEPGSGKSNLINSLANYLTFRNLDSSIIPPVCLIPTASVIGEGTGENEERADDHTHTKTCRNYFFPSQEDGRYVRFIDTPGFPTDRHEQDSYLASILNHVHQRSYLHAVCLVVRVSQGPLSDSFVSMVRLLFSTFLPGTLGNLVLLLTDQDSKTAATSRILKELEVLINEIDCRAPALDHSKTFKFNNEAFPYLVLSFYGEKFHDYEVSKHENSWDSSSEEFQLLFKRLFELQPFSVAAELRVEELVPTETEDVIFNI